MRGHLVLVLAYEYNGVIVKGTVLKALPGNSAEYSRGIYWWGYQGEKEIIGKSHVINIQTNIETR
jgi:hypothetical protein